MKNNLDDEQFFSELEKWSSQEEAFSMNDFLRQKDIDPSCFQSKVKARQGLSKMVGQVSCKLFENAFNAWELHKISRDQFVEYLSAYNFEDPESVAEHLEKDKETKEFYMKYINVENDLESALQAAMKCIKKQLKEMQDENYHFEI